VCEELIPFDRFADHQDNCGLVDDTHLLDLIGSRKPKKKKPQNPYQFMELPAKAKYQLPPGALPHNFVPSIPKPKADHSRKPNAVKSKKPQLGMDTAFPISIDDDDEKSLDVELPVKSSVKRTAKPMAKASRLGPITTTTVTTSLPTTPSRLQGVRSRDAPSLSGTPDLSIDVVGSKTTPTTGTKKPPGIAPKQTVDLTRVSVPVPSRPVQSRPVQSRPVQSRPVPSRPVQTRPPKVNMLLPKSETTHLLL